MHRNLQKMLDRLHVKVASVSPRGTPTFNMTNIMNANGKVVLPTTTFRSTFSYKQHMGHASWVTLFFLIQSFFS